MTLTEAILSVDRPRIQGLLSESGNWYRREFDQSKNLLELPLYLAYYSAYCHPINKLDRDAKRIVEDMLRAGVKIDYVDAYDGSSVQSAVDKALGAFSAEQLDAYRRINSARLPDDKKRDILRQTNFTQTYQEIAGFYEMKTAIETDLAAIASRPASPVWTAEPVDRVSTPLRTVELLNKQAGTPPQRFEVSPGKVV